MQDAAVIGRTAEKESALVQKDVASTSVALSGENIRAQVEGATALRATQTYGSVTSLVSVLDFIDANKSQFSGDDLNTFRKTIDQLYGSNRTYLSGPVQYSFKSNGDILDFLGALTKNNMYPDTATLIDVAELVDAEIDATKRVLISGEKDFLDNKIVAQNSELYTAYLTYRGAIIASQANLRAMISGARSALAGGNLGTLGTNTENTLRTIGYTTASQILENTSQMAHQTDVVVNAGMNVLVGEEALGQPRAPFAGVIDEVFVKNGDFVSPGTPLMTLVGVGAKELKISVSQLMFPYLKEGAEFTVDRVVVGHVARFSKTAMGGNATVVIELSDDDYTPGTTLRGEIQCEPNADGALALPRSYVRFDSDGAFVTTESQRIVRVIILYDTGKVFVVKPVQTIEEKLRKAVGVAF
jgi:multidrug efflux pump subunit AcrA (membrane-fusion protein)